MATRQVKTCADWEAKVRQLAAKARTAQERAYAAAHVETVRRALAGLGPEDGAPTGGASAVVNIANAHLIRLCRQHRPQHYKNGYDRGKLHVGAEPKDRTRRERLDAAIAPLAGCEPKEIYYAAVELNGTGVRFYGDVCMVLRTVDADTVVLDRNSYDLLRAPIAGTFKCHLDAPLRSRLRLHSGTWARDLAAIVATKILGAPRPAGRRMTTGDISDLLLHDEDYVEVILTRSFGVGELGEVRLHPNDVSTQNHLVERLRRGVDTAAAERRWAGLRWRAEDALRARGVAVGVVVGTGRVK